MSISNSTNEVLMVDSSGWDRASILLPSARVLQPLYICITPPATGDACVLHPAYLSLPNAGISPLDHTRFTNPYSLILQFPEPADSLEEVSGSADVLIIQNQVKGDAIDIPSGDMTDDEGYDDNDVVFNTCIPTNGSKDYGLYALMVHEAGHLLGMSGLRPSALLSERGRYEMAHPTIPDSVLNYDDEIPENVDDAGKVIRPEPDCSPYPLDILALNALYQTVD